MIHGRTRGSLQLLNPFGFKILSLSHILHTSTLLLQFKPKSLNQ
uniref:Uncharacterized protein n=1 Tax=Anguilla anguilla TaxID=7936 RepID=A0A0E9UQR6_ANGAN